MKRLLFVCLMACTAMLTMAAVRTKQIEVRTQAQFDRMDLDVKNALRQGVTDLTVHILSGTYYYAEKHLDLSSLQYPKAKITIVGQGALLVGRNGTADANWQMGCFDPQTLRSVDLWTPLQQSPAAVEVVDAASRLCRIRLAGRQQAQSAAQCRGQYVQVTQWYKTMVYPVVRRDRRYLYFTATDLEFVQGFGHWNVNLDCYYGKVNPRYRTLDTNLGSRSYEPCLASTFANLKHSTLGQVVLRGLQFGPNHGAAPLIDTDMLRSSQLLVEDCVFSGVRGLVIRVWYTDQVLIRRNRFEGCYRDGIESFNGSTHTQVIDNVFTDHGMGLSQNFGVICRGADFEIRGNRFRNFCYAAIGVGLYHGHKAAGPVQGVVADNDIAFEPEYYQHYAQHTLMDGGAIYAWTQCDDVRITGNRINHIRGVKDYRGIFCDDGTKNVTVQGNTVTDIGAGCWCIDLRWVESVKSTVPDHNTGNTVSGNKVDGPVRFETRRP